MTVTNMTRRLIQWAASLLFGGEAIRDLRAQSNEPGASATVDTDDADLAEIPPTAEADTEISEGALTGAMVLVAEDDPFMLGVADLFLDTFGATRILADNGREAVAQAKKAAFDIILLNLHMPEMDGYQASREIRRLPGYAAVPILAITGDAVDVIQADPARYQHAGMDGVLRKPYTKMQLYQAIVGLLEGESRRGWETGTWFGIDADKLFLAHHRDTADKILAALHTGQTDMAALNAHNLASAARMVGANELAELSLSLEQALLQGENSPREQTLAQRIHQQASRLLDRASG